MRASEVFLRAGSSLGGWFVAYGHAMVIAVIPATECAQRPNPNEVWLASAILWLPAAAAALWLIPAALLWRTSFRWLALPLAPLLLYDASVALPYLQGVTFGEQSLCGVLQPGLAAGEPAPWQRLWAPAQLVLLGGFAWRAWQFWRPADAAGQS